MIAIGLDSCIRAKWLYSRKSGFIRAKWLYSGKSGCIRAKWFYSDKVFVFGRSCCNLSKNGCFKGK